MADPDKRSVTMEELLVSSLAQTDALASVPNHDVQLQNGYIA
jgi:hypothetical protein